MKEFATGAIERIVKDAILSKKITLDVLVTFSSLMSLDQTLDDDGNTAMLLAFIAGNYPLVEMLIKRGYSPNTPNRDGYSVFILIEETINEFEKCDFLDLDDEMLICYNLHQVMTSCYFPQFPNPSLIPRTWRYPVKAEEFIEGDRAAEQVQQILNQRRISRQQTSLVQHRADQLEDECDRLEKEIDRYRQLFLEVDQENLTRETFLRNKVKGYRQLVIQLHERLADNVNTHNKSDLVYEQKIKQLESDRDRVISDNRELIQLTKHYKNRVDAMSSMDGRYEEVVERNEILKDALQTSDEKCHDLEVQLETRDSWLAEMEITLKGLGNQHQTITNNYNDMSDAHQKLVSMVHQYIIFHDYILEMFPEIRDDAPLGEIMGKLETIAERDFNSQNQIDKLCKTIRLFESRMDAEELNEMLILVQQQIDA